MSEEKTLMVTVPEDVLDKFQFYCAQQGCTPSYRVLQLIEKDMGVAPDPALVENPQLQEVALDTSGSTDDPKMLHSDEKVPTIEELRTRKEHSEE
tara:strand:+ start:1268 stop:1552 length:285 start_codon:yes stop_codon:yes gene_type:complete